MSAKQQPSLFGRVLVGVDDEGRSDGAVRVGAEFARVLSSHVELVHSVALPDHCPGSGNERRDANRLELATLNAQLITSAWKSQIERLGKVIAGTSLADVAPQDLLYVTSFPPPRAILEHGKQTAAELIFLGPHKRRDFFDFGNTARTVLAKSDVPVWIQVEEPRPLRSILVPVDLSDESRRTQELTSALAAAFGARVSVMHCIDPSTPTSAPPAIESEGAVPNHVRGNERAARDKQLRAFVDSCEWNGADHEVLLTEGDPASRILEFAEMADLVVIGTHGLTGLASAVLGGVAYRVLKDAKTPILASRHPHRSWIL